MGILSWWKRLGESPSDAEITRALEVLLPSVAVPTDAELAEVWVRDGYGTLVRARHILFMVPCGATPTDRECVRQQAEAIRSRAAAGEDFLALAREYSMEPGGSQRAGDVGFFGRGRMVKDFESAAFSLQPGRVSEVVETPFGYHVIRVEEHRAVELREKTAFRKKVVQAARKQIFQTYMENLKAGASLKVLGGAETRMRELAKGLDKKQWAWSARRPLVRFKGGKFTEGELVEVLNRFNPQALAQLPAASNEGLRTFLENQAIRNLIWVEATKSRPQARPTFPRWTSNRLQPAPGTRLLWFADFFYSPKSVEEVLLPTITDMRGDYNVALRDGRRSKAGWVRVRGTWDFVAAACALTMASVGDTVVRLWNLFRSV